MTWNPVSRHRLLRALVPVVACLAVLAMTAWRAEAQVEPFVGSYSGSGQLLLADGTTQDRDLSVEIAKTAKGFRVKWSTITLRSDGTENQKSYEIDFLPTSSDGLYASAMKKDLFGNETPLNPMKGEPYVWGQINGETLTVFAFFVDASGGYEIQEYDRTLVDGGLRLDFTSIRNGDEQRTLTAVMKADR